MSLVRVQVGEPKLNPLRVRPCGFFYFRVRCKLKCAAEKRALRTRLKLCYGLEGFAVALAGAVSPLALPRTKKGVPLGYKSTRTVWLPASVMKIFPFTLLRATW